MSVVDAKVQELWDKYTEYKDKMFENTDKAAPWIIVDANRKTNARIEVLEHILKHIKIE